MGEPYKPDVESMRAREERLTQEAWERLSRYGVTPEDIRTKEQSNNNGTPTRLRLKVAELFLQGETAKNIVIQTELAPPRLQISEIPSSASGSTT